MTPRSEAASAPAGEPSGAGPGVLHIVRNLKTGGAQEVVRTLVQNLADLGARPVVCSLANGPLADEIRRCGIPVELISSRNHDVLSPLSFVRESRRIRNDIEAIVARHRIDIIQTHLLRSIDFVAARVRGPDGRRLPLFWTFHNEAFTLRAEHLRRHRWLLGPKRLAYRLRYRVGARRVAGLIAVSADVRRALLREVGSVGDRIVVIRNGVDTRRYERTSSARAAIRAELDLDDTAQIVIMVATFKEQKGHSYLVDAIKALAPSGGQVRVLLVGDGQLRSAIERQVAAENLADRFHFLGDRRDVPELLGGADIFVLPSLWEGLPMALLEAMATGLPCIATAVSGVTEVIDQESGIVVAPRDVAAMTEALGGLLADREGGLAMGQRARARVEETFSARRQAREHLKLYRHGVSLREGS